MQADSLNRSGDSELVDLIASSIGGILLRTSAHETPVEMLASYEAELCDRLAYPWLSPTSVSRKRLAFVEARKDIEVSKRMWEAAVALNIDLVIIDNPGHWLEDDHGPYAHFREAFVPTNISVDDGFTNRIVSAVQAYSFAIDGIMTVSDSRLIGVAKACEILSLPTSPSSSYIVAADKYRTRMMEPDHQGAFQVSSVSELQQHLKNVAGITICYPLIVKPTLGWGSECVTKVADEQQLLSAVSKASARHAESPQKSRTVAIEPYIDGPEVDANFVLLNGEVLFFEVTDDFPCTGDKNSTSAAHNFLETQMLMPSRLPADELQVLKTSIHQSILRQGFVTGTFHCEARMLGSKAEYRSVDGTLDLQINPSSQKVGSVGVWLLEINARPSGYMESAAVNLVYGVDYFALQMLFAIGDEARFRDLAIPYRTGPQCNLLVQFVPQDKTGIMKNEDVGAELLASNPDIAEHVAEHKTWVKKGDKLLGPEGSELLWLAYFLIVHEKREQTLRVGEDILRRLTYEVQEV